MSFLVPGSSSIPVSLAVEVDGNLMSLTSIIQLLIRGVCPHTDGSAWCKGLTFTARHFEVNISRVQVNSDSSVSLHTKNENNIKNLFPPSAVPSIIKLILKTVSIGFEVFTSHMGFIPTHWPTIGERKAVHFFFMSHAVVFSVSSIFTVYHF